MEEERQPGWAAAIAAMSASVRRFQPGLSPVDIVGGDPLSLAVAEAMRRDEDVIARSWEVRARLEATLTEVQRILATRLELD